MCKEDKTLKKISKKILIIFILNTSAFSWVLSLFTFSSVKDYVFTLIPAAILFGTYMTCVLSIVEINETVKTLLNKSKEQETENKKDKT